METMKCERSGRSTFEDLYNIDTQEQVAVHICGFEGIQGVITSKESQLK